MDRTYPKITFIGHATTLIELGDQAFLTDPNFSKKIFITGKRTQEAGMNPRDLPDLSAILISHARYDHLDVFSYKFFKTTVPILVPKGLGSFVKRFLPNPVTEIPPDGHHQQRQITLHALPVKQQGFRWIPLRYREATAYLIESSLGNIYFAGDTAYGGHFKQSGEKYPVRVALLPIASEGTHKTGSKGTLNPGGFFQALGDLKAEIGIPIRWGAFTGGKLGFESMLEELRAEGERRGMIEKLKILRPGECLEIKDSTLDPSLTTSG